MSLPIIQTIQSNINNLKSTKTDIKNAVNTDYDFIANEQIESYPDLIKQGIAHYKNRVPHATKEGTDLSFNAAPLKFENMTIKGNTEQASLPEGYTALDYIESDGTQYIDTGINADSNLRVLLDLQYKNTNENDSQIGAIYKTGTSTYKRHHVFQRLSSNTISVGISSSTYNTATMDTNRHIIDMSTSKIVVDNNEYSVSVADFDTELNYWLLGRNSNDASLSKLSKSKLYKCQMWYNNVLVRDYVPCKNSQNEIGLYDLASQTFFANDGTGDFIAGNEVGYPNPDHPQDIHVVTGNNTVEVQGKNLLDVNNTTNGYIDNDGQVVAVTYVTNRLTDYIEFSNSITISLDTTIYGIGYALFDENKNYLSRVGRIANTDKHTISDNSAKYIRIWFNYDNSSPTTTELLLQLKAMIEKGTQSTSYEPYYYQEYPINLGSIELCKIGNYQDYLYKENGNWYKYGAIGKVICDGVDEGWALSTTKENTQVFVNAAALPTATALTNAGYCNYFKNQDGDTEKFATTRNQKTLYIAIFKTTASTVDNFKTWLTTHNTILYYPVVTPVLTQITDPTLISQLEALDKAKGNNGTTIITTSGDDLAPILNFTAYLKEVE